MLGASPLLDALLVCLCLAVAARGVVMVRDRGPAARFMITASSTVGRESVVRRLSERLRDLAAPRTAALLGAERLQTIRRRLASAGRSGETVEDYVGRKGASTILYASAGLLLSLTGGNPLPLLLLGTLGWMSSDIVLARQARLRQERLDRDLPDFLDVLAVSVSAGVSFRPAMKRVADSLTGPVGEEILTALRQMELGSSRRVAFVALRERNDSEFVAQFVTALLQAEELGVPLASALTDISREMRRSASQRGRQRAQRAAPRISLISTTLLLPGALILIIVSLLLLSGVSLGGL